MTTLYKLTGANDCTMYDTPWGEGIENTASGEGELCFGGFLHAYEHPLVAVLMNPIHGNFREPHLWLADGDVTKRDGQLKCGCTRLKTIKRLELSVITTEQQVVTAIRCAKRVCDDELWNEWADAWVNGEDRTAGAAWAAELAAEAAAVRAARSAAVRAARSAAWAAEARAAGEVAARSAARAAAATARAAAWAAAWAAAEDSDFDLIAILEEVCEGKS